MHVRMLHAEFLQLCLTLCEPMDCSPPGSSVLGVSQARILEWVAISFSRGSSRPRDRTQVSHIAGRGFNLWATREAQDICGDNTKSYPCRVWENQGQSNSNNDNQLPCILQKAKRYTLWKKQHLPGEIFKQEAIDQAKIMVFCCHPM